MWMQTVNKSDTERVWINYTNSDGQTITAHYPIFKICANRNTASVSTNEYAHAVGAVNVNGAEGAYVGLSYEDVAETDVGVCQIYGYHESVIVYRIVGSVTVIPGNPLGPGIEAASVGVSSTGATFGLYGPIVALDTVTATMHSLGSVNYADHVFLRGM